MSLRNPFVRLVNALPKYPKLYGTVTTVEDGTVVVTLLGGGVLRATGSGYSVGAKVFIRNGLVEGEAPNMPAGEIVLP